MAILKLPKGVKLQGKCMGGSIRNMKDGRFVFAACPGPRDKRKKRKKGQHSTVVEFVYAAKYYVKLLRSDPNLYEFYRSRAKGKQKPHNVAVSDYRIPPKVTYLDTSSYTGVAGEKVRIGAVDNVMVTSVHVRLLAMDGTLVEEGDAVQRGASEEWNYTTIVQVEEAKVKWVVTAMDKPGNTDTMEVIWEKVLLNLPSNKKRKKAISTKEVVDQNSDSQEKSKRSMSHWTSHCSGYSSYSYRYSSADVSQKKRT